MGRIMTLRGKFQTAFGAAASYGDTAGKIIFEYESPDRTRAWKIRKALAWVQAPIGTGGTGRAWWAVSLLTDQLQNDFIQITDAASANKYLNAIGPADNRSVAWMTQDMIRRDNVNADWLTAHGATSEQATSLQVDVDRYITNELYIVSYGVTEGALHELDASYYIELEEVKLSPSESLFAQLKGTGQEVGTTISGFHES